MLDELERNFTAVEKKILKLTDQHRKLVEEHKELVDRFQRLKTKYEEANSKVEELQEEERRVKLMAALAGNPDHNRLMKNHINRLVKEIDICIAGIRDSES